MPTKKVYLLIKVRVPYNLVSEFNEYWGKELLPHWQKAGARHIGSFQNFVGDPSNEILRLFEFESILKWYQWEEFLAQSEEGQNLVKGLSRFLADVEKKLLLSIY